MIKEQTIIPGLSEEKIKYYTSETIYQRGAAYYERGAVTNIIQCNHRIQAEVEGSQYQPYQVAIQFDEAGIQSCECNCPYDDSYCKHVVAVLLVCLNAPEEIRKSEVLTQKLRRLNKIQLCELVEQFAAQDSSLHHQIVFFIDQHETDDAINANQPSQSARKTIVDPKPYAQEAKRILHSLDRMRLSEAYWHVGNVIDNLSAIINKAQVFIEKNDGNNAVIILKALTEVYVKDWICLDGSDGETGDFFYELDDAWTEAILSADFSQSEKQKLLQKIQVWNEKVVEYGIDQAFAKAMLALKQGWDYPPLVSVLNGELIDTITWDEEQEDDDDYRPSIIDIRIKILVRQQRFNECLCLAKAKQMIKEACSLMIQQGQIKEAVDYAKTYLKKSNDAFLIAQLLRDRGIINEAMVIATIGLELKGPKSELGDWLSDLAENKNDLSLSLKAIIAAFQDQPTLKRYEEALRLATNAKIKNIKETLLIFLRESNNFISEKAKVDIFLKENLLDDAVRSVEKAGDYFVSDVKRVMDAVLSYKPEWVIQQGIQRVQAIINPAQAKYYQDAIIWLKKVKQAYVAMNQEDQWMRYLNDLRKQHKQKYKLMNLLDKTFGRS